MHDVSACVCVCVSDDVELEAPQASCGSQHGLAVKGDRGVAFAFFFAFFLSVCDE